MSTDNWINVAEISPDYIILRCQMLPPNAFDNILGWFGPVDEGNTCVQVPIEAVGNDAFYNGVLYARPEYGLAFNVTTLEWELDHDAIAAAEAAKLAEYATHVATRKAIMVIDSIEAMAADVQNGMALEESFAKRMVPEVFYDQWIPNERYLAGAIISYAGLLYDVMIEHVSIPTQPPNAEGLLALYRPRGQQGGDEPTGEEDDPYFLLVGMPGVTGKYYSYSGKVYKCLREMANVLQNWLPGSPGVESFWEYVRDE